MPILKSFAKEVIQHQKAEEKKEKAMQREAERAQKRLEKEADRALSELGFNEYPSIPIPQPKIPGIGLNEKELRQVLMDEAKSRMDMAEAGIIAREPVDKLIERFEKWVGSQQTADSSQSLEVNDRRSTAPGRAAPPDGPRKKHREKRKKKK